MTTQSSFEYYSDSTRHGEYQYVTIEQIITDFLASRDDDDFTSTVRRDQVLYQSMRGLRNFYYDLAREVRAVELTLSPTLQVILPPDFVNYVRISWVDDGGTLHPLAEDRTMTISQVYLQDNNYDLLFDNNGCVLQGSQRQNTSQINALGDELEDLLEYRGVSSYQFCEFPFDPNRDFSKVYPNGKYRIDKEHGVIHFSSDAQERNIVLEYVSDGLYTGCEGRPENERRVHKFLEDAMHDYIYYHLIKKRRNVPFNEKRRAEKDFFRSRKIGRRRLNGIKIEELLQTFRGDSKWIKG